MTAQDKELAQLHDTMVDEIKSLVDKYMSIVGWDVPENDEPQAKKKIINIFKDALEEIEREDN
ncbi:hypothetical protein [Arcobacter sp. FWKO B]|uniref:hypothetical protein n=1 Tax=Arcobacter sp. FWKO B TaxID=2593672 RepID=UPI0018A55965|nr:hypothetical protein [Arcobacter sp. FWKO B]QOG11715.1 hypothetical protein FWKOB_02915 [Arcobacter sp. FWKO B]